MLTCWKLTMLNRLLAAALPALVVRSAIAKLTWANTKHMIVFGDSYTTNGFNISAGVDSPVPGFTSSNGPNWVSFLGQLLVLSHTTSCLLVYDRVYV